MVDAIKVRKVMFKTFVTDLIFDATVAVSINKSKETQERGIAVSSFVLVQGRCTINAK